MFSDINECDSKDRGESLCGNNTKCSNKIGTYHCPCCDGFEKDENGTCVGMGIFINLTILSLSVP